MIYRIFLVTILMLGSCGSGSIENDIPEPSDTNGLIVAPAPVPTLGPPLPADDGSATPSSAQPFTMTEISRLNQPWAMAVIGNGPYALITEKPGRLILFNMNDTSKKIVSDTPSVDYGGQGGLGDVVMAPDANTSDSIYPLYLSWVEAGSGDTRGAVVGRADLIIDAMNNGAVSLENMEIIWRQDPKVTGRGHFSHRIAIAPDQQHIFITSGERQKFDPAQDKTVNLGKVIRLKLDGSTPADNPFVSEGGLATHIWSLGHRNGLGLTFDAQGRLWESEMGPKGGDEVNLVRRAENYGYPLASNGSHYDDSDIPDHMSGDGFAAPSAWWTPSISPAGMAYYEGAMFPQWRGSLLLGALSGKALVRLQIQGDQLHKADYWPMQRIREVEIGPDGAVWLLEDGSDARLLKLTPN